MEEALTHRGALQTFWSTVRPRLEILHMFQPIQSMQYILNHFLWVYDHLVKYGVFSATHFTFRWHVCVCLCVVGLSKQLSRRHLQWQPAGGHQLPHSDPSAPHMITISNMHSQERPVLLTWLNVIQILRPGSTWSCIGHCKPGWVDLNQCVSGSRAA